MHIEQCPCGRARAGCEYHDIPTDKPTDKPVWNCTTPEAIPKIKKSFVIDSNTAKHLGIANPGDFVFEEVSPDNCKIRSYIVRRVNFDGSMECELWSES